MSSADHTANTKHLYNIHATSANIVYKLYECFAFAGGQNTSERNLNDHDDGSTSELIWLSYIYLCIKLL